MVSLIWLCWTGWRQWRRSDRQLWSQVKKQPLMITFRREATYTDYFVRLSNNTAGSKFWSSSTFTFFRTARVHHQYRYISMLVCWHSVLIIKRWVSLVRVYCLSMLSTGVPAVRVNLHFGILAYAILTLFLIQQWEPEVGIYKRKQDSKKARINTLSTKEAIKKKKRTHALEQESG